MNRSLALLARLAVAGAMLLAFAAPASASSHALVRVLHASPDAPAVDVFLDDTKVDALTNVPFGAISDYLEVPAGDHNVKVYATGTTADPVIDADVTVATGGMYTIAATGAVASIEAQVLEDAPAPSCDTAQVRVIHFSADAPAVDVAPAGAAPADAVVKNLAYPNATDYLALPGGSYDLEVRLAGTTTVALALPGVAIEDCNAYSVFAIGSAAAEPLGGNALQVVVAVDATAEATAPSESAGPAATPPATDAVMPGNGSSTDGLGLVAALLVAGAASLGLGIGMASQRRREPNA
ncbi:MAG TPA: DUF4397 domain-containing protein [Candidatus Limnocylindrales bacterium]|nr:DUF4397 domain-containing protein [Candidatus Limnocylindrales bacterium]